MRLQKLSEARSWCFRTLKDGIYQDQLENQKANCQDLLLCYFMPCLALTFEFAISQDFLWLCPHHPRILL